MDPHDRIFSVRNIDVFGNTMPQLVVNIKDIEMPTDYRVNHFLLKNNDDTEPSLSCIKHKDVSDFIHLCLEFALKNGLPIQDRYWYLTVDQGLVTSGHTLREMGWHIDGMQGKEVPHKKPGDFQFIWSNVLQTEFCKQIFDTTDLNPDIHNVFTFLGKQVDENNIYSFNDGDIVLMHCYHVHRSKVYMGDTQVYRKFVRLSFTHTPITSTKLIINDDMKYNYTIHTTDGNIPTDLI